MQFSKNMKIKEAKEYVAKKLNVETMDLADEYVMRELREELDIGVITSVPGAAKGIAAKMNIEKLLDVKINSCNLFRKPRSAKRRYLHRVHHSLWRLRRKRDGAGTAGNRRHYDPVLHWRGDN